MKILAPLQSVLPKPFYNPKLPLLNKLACITNAVNLSNISFTNPDRQNSKMGHEIKPLHIKVRASRDESHGRVYNGDYPSVTTILDATRPKSDLFALLNWRKKRISDLGQTGYEEMAAKIKNRGSSFHQAIKQYLLTGDEPDLLDYNKGHWQSLAHVLPNIDKVIALESVVVHPQLKYAGTLDGLVSYQGQLCLVDWKTSEKKRTVLKDCFSYPHQVVAYAGAVNYDQNYGPIQVSTGLLVLAYCDGSPADTIWMSPETCQYYWNEWLLRLELYKHLGDAKAFKNQQGTKLKDIAHYVGGIPVPASTKMVPDDFVEPEVGLTRLRNEERGDSTVVFTNVSEWLEGTIDILDDDPSVAEFDHLLEHQTDINMDRE